MRPKSLATKSFRPRPMGSKFRVVWENLKTGKISVTISSDKEMDALSSKRRNTHRIRSFARL